MSTIKIIDGESNEKIYQTVGQGNATYPLMSVVPDYKLALAIAEIESTYNDVVNIHKKAKSLIKFGRNKSIGNSFETLAEFQGSVANETFVSTNIIDSIVSSNAGDNQTIVIEGHTIDGVGNLTFVVQEAILNGQSEVVLGTALARVNRAYVKSSGVFNTIPADLAGTVSIYDNTDGITAGIPDTDAATKLVIKAGETQSQKCATSISSQDYWILTHFGAAIGIAGNSSNYAEVRIEIKDIFNGGVWRPIGRTISLVPNSIGRGFDFEPCLIIPKNHDIKVVAKVNSGTAEIYAQIGGYLAIIES